MSWGAGSRSLGARPFKREPEPVKDIYKNGSQELGARPFLEGTGAYSQVKKGIGSPTLSIIEALVFLKKCQNYDGTDRYDF